MHKGEEGRVVLEKESLEVKRDQTGQGRKE